MANISKITLPNGSTYNIYDSTAIHQSDITALMVLKGTKAAYSDLPQSNNYKGDVWLISDTGEEYIWDGSNWIRLGYDIQAASISHIHNVEINGENSPSTVTGSVTITVPKAVIGTKYISATAVQGEVTAPINEVLGSATTFTTQVTPATTNIKATASDTVVAGNGTADAVTSITPDKGAAMGVDATFKVSGGTATTNKLATTTLNNPSVQDISIPTWTMEDVAIPNVTSVGSTTAGKAASWEAKVEDNILKFNWTTNTPTIVAMPTLGTPLVANKASVGTAIPASKVDISEVTVATGQLSASGAGADVATGIDTISVSVNDAKAVSVIKDIDTDTTAVLTDVKVVTQPTIALETGATAGTGVVSVATGITSAITSHNANDKVNAVTSVVVANPTVTLSESTFSSTGDVAVNTVSNSTDTATGDITATAAAQTWKQTGATVGVPIN